MDSQQKIQTFRVLYAPKERAYVLYTDWRNNEYTIDINKAKKFDKDFEAIEAALYGEMEYFEIRIINYVEEYEYE